MNWRFGMVAAAVLAAVPGSAAEVKDRPLEQMNAALKLGQANDAKGCLKIARDVIASRAFDTYRDQFRAWTFTVASFCANDAGERDEAHDYAVRGTAIEGASDDLWRMRLLREFQNEAHPEAAVVGLEAMAQRAPEVLNGIPQQWLYMFYNRIKKMPDAGLKRRMLEVLAAKSYDPNEVGGSADYFRSELAKLRGPQGDRAGAAALIATISQPGTLLDLSLDPRTRTFIPVNFDIRAATERELAHRRDVAASHPNSLNAVIEVANALRWLGRYEEALAGLEAASPEGLAGASFTDRADRQNWWWDAVGYAHSYLGHYDASLAAFRHGIDAKESGAINVSQTINLANQQLIFGRNAEAIATLAPLGDGKGASPYGVMQLIGVRGCARFRSGDKAGADADYAYAKAHDADAPATLTGLALCRNDLDTSAASLVRRLGTPDQLVEALLMVSDFDPMPPAYPKQVEDERLEQVKLRPEVKAAIARAGGARRFNMQSVPF